MDKQQQKEIGMKLGFEAFHAGKKCVPAHDKRLCALIPSSSRAGTTIQLLDGWLKAWHTENLKGDK